MNSSMKRFLAARGKMVHVSNPLVPTPVTYADGTLGTEMLPAPSGSKANKTYNVGRNAEKRRQRASGAEFHKFLADLNASAARRRRESAIAALGQPYGRRPA
jgi:hypothetical protein